jgi:hypothetical protein
MTDPDPTHTPPPPVPPTSRQRYRWPLLVTIAVAVVIVGSQLINYVVLPACDSDRIQQAVHDIFVGLEVEILSLDGFRDLPDSPTGKMCEAMIQSPEERARIEFLVAWDGWTPFVRIENVVELE